MVAHITSDALTPGILSKLTRIPSLPRPQKTTAMSKSDRRPSTSSPNDNVIGIYSNKLRYNDQWFKKGESLFVVDVSGAGKYTAKLLATNETEVGLMFF